MDKITFTTNYKLSRGQITRLLAKAASDGGRFYLDGCGWFRVSKNGSGKTSPVDIVPERPEVENKEQSVPPTVDSPVCKPETPRGRDKSELGKMSATELRNQKLIAEIEKTRQATERGRLAIRQEFLDELIPVLTESLSGLRIELERLRLPPEELSRLRDALEQAMRKIGGVQHGNT